MNFSLNKLGFRTSGKRPHKQLFLAMKLTTCLVIIALVQVSATGFSQITLNEKNIPIVKVLDKIEKQTGYVFLYDENNIASKNIDVKTNNASLKDVLDKYFRAIGINYQINGKNITLKSESANFTVTSKLVSIDVKGQVSDVSGKPLPGVTVRLEGNNPNNKVVVTNEKGMFIITSVPVGSKISFTAIGFTSRGVTVDDSNIASGSKTINVVLEVDVKQLESVTINTGIYTRKANSFTGSTLVITGDELKKVGNGNFFQSLKNISPSMVLDNFTAGSNPNALPDIQLRGTSTFPADNANSSLKGNYERSPNQPLFILDGFEASIERVYDLDMNRIASVTILKDAASKAIYGSKAANGVIVIETKQNTSSKPLVTYNTSLDLDLPDLRSYNLTNSTEKLQAEVIDGMYTRTTDADTYANLQQLYFARKKLTMEGLDTYWLAKPLRNGVGQKHNLNVELGGSDLRILANVSYQDVKGVMIGNDRKNISGNLTTSYRVNNLLFRNITSANKNNTAESPYGSFSDYARMNPYWRAENIDGSIPYYAEIGMNGFRVTNPLYNASLNSKDVTSYFNFTNNFYLEWTILEGLKATTRLGIDIINNDADEFYPASHTRFDSYSIEDANRKGSYQVNNGKGQTLSGDLNVNYSKEIGKNVFFSNLGFNVSDRNFNEVAHTVEGFSSDKLDNLLFGRGYLIDSKPIGNSSIIRDLGFLGAFSYMYDNRFLLDLTGRLSASSQFGADKRWANFWSAGLGWNLHNENFMKSFEKLRQLKIRGSIGSTGNSNFPTNASVATYQYYQQSFYQGFPGSYLTNLANSNLQWESKFDYNIGFDANIDNKLNVKFDYYKSFTKNLVTDISVPNSTGFSTVKDNLGKVSNTGFEVYATYLLWSKKESFFNINVGLETNKNKIVELSNAMKAFNANMDKIAADQGNNVPVKKYVDGMSMNAIWAVPSLGIDPATGQEIYVDRNGATTYIYNPQDLVVAGDAYSPYQGVIGFSAEHKGVGLSVTGRYLFGGQLYNQTLVDKVENVDMNFNVDKRVLTGRWTAPGQNALFKRLGTYNRPNEDGSVTAYDEQTRATTRFVQDRNEFTIAAVNLYYILNNRLTKKMGLQRLKVGFNMNELATFSSIEIERGLTNPFAKTLSFNLSATF